MIRILLVVLSCSWAVALPGQSLALDANRTVVDEGTGLILAAVDLSAVGGLDRVTVGDREFPFLEAATGVSYAETYAVMGTNSTLQLYFTQLPVLFLNTDLPIVEDDRVDFTLRYVDPAETFSVTGGVEFRGNSDGPEAKNSLDLEFDDDVSFLGLREDDDWILDALNNEPLKVNSYLSHALWLDMFPLPYAAEEPEAKAGVEVRFVEVVVNGNYQGIMLLSEEIDRKQLKLKRVEDGERRGELYQGDKDRRATRYEAEASVPDNADNDWSGWDYEFPDEDDFPLDWNKLYDFYRLVAERDAATFENDIAGAYDLDNAVDYLLFGNAVNAEDNFSENCYLVRYDRGTPYFTIPWDLDNTFGNADELPTTDAAGEWLSNGLYDRLTTVSPDRFNSRLCDRFTDLRSGLLSDDRLQLRLTEAYDLLSANNALAREEQRWPELTDATPERLEATRNFLAARMSFVEGFVCGLAVSTDDLPEEADWSVFPNPARAQVIIQAEVPAGRVFELYDGVGRSVRQGRLSGAGATRIRVADLPPGVYTLRVGRSVRRVLIQ